MADQEALCGDMLEEYHDAVNSYLNFDDGLNLSSKKKGVSEITQSFKSKGLELRYGRWTVQEKKLFHQNFHDFVTNYEEQIGNPTDFTVTSDDKVRAREVKKLKKDLDFVRYISRGLFRERRLVEGHIIFTLDPLAISNHQRYSVEDLHQLKTLVDKHGRKWKLISKEMGRSIASLQSAHRNFFLHEGYDRKAPTLKQQKRLVKQMKKHFPDTDFTCELVAEVPWNEIANKIGFLHGKYLHGFWESKVKAYNDEGKLVLRDPPRNIPFELLRKFVKHVAKQRPTHLDGLDWQHYYRMLSGYIPGGVGLRAILSALLRRYKINASELGLADATSLLSQRMKRVKKLGFQSIWAEIQVDKVKLTRIPEYHWALTPDLAHYVHDTPCMYLGYGETYSDAIAPADIKQEPVDMDEVW